MLVCLYSHLSFFATAFVSGQAGEADIPGQRKTLQIMTEGPCPQDSPSFLGCFLQTLRFLGAITVVVSTLQEVTLS